MALICQTSLPHAKAEDPAPKAGDFKVKRATVSDSEGNSIEAENGRLYVPENRSKADSKAIQIAFVRLKSKATSPAAPLIYLAGGPGGSSTQFARNPNALSSWRPLLELGDVVLLDQRGTGMSRPNLQWKPTGPLPSDFFLSRERAIEQVVPICEEAAGHFRGKGVDLSGYTTAESADDINDVRIALGADKVSLLGHSYGTHLGLATIRRHSAHLANVVLVGTEGPNDTRKLPSTYDRQLGSIAKQAANDPGVSAHVPDLAALAREVMQKLEREPVRVTVKNPMGGDDVELRVGRFGLQYILVRDMGDTSDIPVLPRLLHDLKRGDTRILQWFVQKRFNELASLSAMFFVMDASSGATAERWAKINEEAKSSLFGNAMNFLFPEVDAAWGTPDLGDDFRAPITTDVRTLFISGTLDSNTPPSQADAVRKTFKRSTHLVVENGGHEDLMPNAEVKRAVVRFMKGEDVSDVRVAYPALKFVPIVGIDPAVTHPSVPQAD